jgi:hypothetical protein
MDRLKYLALRRKVVRELENNVGAELADDTLAEFLIEVAREHASVDGFRETLVAVRGYHGELLLLCSTFTFMFLARLAQNCLKCSSPIYTQLFGVTRV